MRSIFLALAFASLVAGRSYQQDLCEMFSDAGFAVVVTESADRPVEPEPAPEKCEGKCKGTGKVLSGDGLALVDCDCPDNCPCKTNRSCDTEKCEQ